MSRCWTLSAGSRARLPLWLPSRQNNFPAYFPRPLHTIESKAAPAPRPGRFFSLWRPCGEQFALMACENALLLHTQPGPRSCQGNAPLHAPNLSGTPESRPPQAPLRGAIRTHGLRKLSYPYARSRARDYAGATHSRTPPIPAGRQRTARRRRLANCRRLLYDRHRISPERRA